MYDMNKEPTQTPEFKRADKSAWRGCYLSIFAFVVGILSLIFFPLVPLCVGAIILFVVGIGKVFSGIMEEQLIMDKFNYPHLFK